MCTLKSNSVKEVKFGMRQPLTSMGEQHARHADTCHQNRIFHLVTLSPPPLLLLGVVQRGVLPVTVTGAAMPRWPRHGRECRDADGKLRWSNLRAYQRGRQRDNLPDPVPQNCAAVHSEYTKDTQTAMRAAIWWINMSRGIPTQPAQRVDLPHGMYRLVDAANWDEVAHLLSEWAEQHAAMM